jgi:fimbrial chaperone protein
MTLTQTLARTALVAAFAVTASVVSAQSLTVLPVSIEMAPGQSATTLTLINSADTETSVQIRAYAWDQPGGEDALTPSTTVLTSPPIATIPASSAQIVRLVLRQPPVGKEATYRIIVDQIPAPAEPGTVRIALRLSIPVFAQPRTRALPKLAYRIERKGDQAWLVATNEGKRHETLRSIAMTGGLSAPANASPYVLAGATRRWPLTAASGLPAAGAVIRLNAGADAGPVDQPVPVIVLP